MRRWDSGVNKQLSRDYRRDVKRKKITADAATDAALSEYMKRIKQ